MPRDPTEVYGTRMERPNAVPREAVEPAWDVPREPTLFHGIPRDSVGSPNRPRGIPWEKTNLILWAMQTVPVGSHGKNPPDSMGYRGILQYSVSMSWVI